MSKIQYNATSAKSFRTTIAKFYVARHSIADYVLKNKASLKAWTTIAQTDSSALADLLLNGNEQIRSEHEIRESLAKANAQISAINASIKKFSDKFDSAVEKANNLVTDALYKSAKADFEDGTDTFNAALAEWFKAQGLTDATPENVPVLQFGAKKASAKKSCKDGVLVDFMSKKAWAEMFIRTLADQLVTDKCIDTYKYKFELPVKK